VQSNHARVSLDFLKENRHPREIIFCLYGDEAREVFEKTLASLEG
jgi:O-acetyl-ADP-ribose deacetylase (regulator of RNase III)